MTVDVKQKVYAVVEGGRTDDVNMALFSKREDAVREIEVYTGKKEENWELDDGAILEEDDTVLFLRECEIN